MSKRRVSNWLLGYRDYASGTECPEIYHLWVGLSCLASAAQRKIFMEHDYFKTHTNMYVVLVGPSGARKTTALRLGKRLLQNTAAYGHEVHFSSNATSTAALIQQFIKLGHEEHQSLTTFSSELGTLIRSTDTDIVGFLTDIYDCEPGWDKQTIGRGLELIEKPWLNLVGATTPDWMKDNLGKLSIEGGFVRRVLFVYAEEHGLIAEPKMTEKQKKLQKDLTHDLAHIVSLDGKFTYADEEARKFYVDWYENPKRLEVPKDSRLKSYYECKADHVRKIAMLLSLAESDSLELKKFHIETALNLLGEVETGMQKALSSVGKNPYNTDLDRIADQVITEGRITYKKLLALNIYALDKRTFDDNLATLAEIDKVVLKDGVVYSPTEWKLEKRARSKG